MTKVRVVIKAEVTASVELRDGETLEELTSSDVDIYLHRGSHIEKIDLGSDRSSIEVIEI